jgi:Putative MetA-pathway of phenol degradation
LRPDSTSRNAAISRQSSRGRPRPCGLGLRPNIQKGRARTLDRRLPRRRRRGQCGLRRGVLFVLAIARRVIGIVLAGLAAVPTAAVAQQAAASAAGGPQDADQDLGGAPEGDVLNRTNLLQLFYSVKTAPGSGPNGTIRTVTTDTFKLRADTSVPLSSDWQLALRSDLPFVAKDPLNSSNPNADFLDGLGDADVQAALIHEVNARWTTGFGARLIMPTGDWDDGLGSGRWQIMPIAGVRYALPEISPGTYFEPVVRYDESFAGYPPRKSISNLQFAPMVNFSRPTAGSSLSTRARTSAGTSAPRSPAKQGDSFCPSTPGSDASSLKPSTSRSKSACQSSNNIRFMISPRS